MSEQMQRLLRERELASELRVSVWTVQDWRRKGTGPAVTRLGPQSIRYARVDVDAWLARRRSAR